MYIPGLNSCSTVIHLLVQYPRTVIALGLASAVGLQISPIGPGPHMGSESLLGKYEERVIKETQIKKYYPHIMAAFEDVRPLPISRRSVEDVLKRCGDCTDINIDAIMSDDYLYNKVKFLYFLELIHLTKDIEKAKQDFVQRNPL